MRAQNISNFTSQTLSATDAGKQFGYTNDYITRLAREKKILATRIGRQWYVDPTSVENFIAQAERAKKAQAEKIRTERKRDQQVLDRKRQAISFVPIASRNAVAFSKVGLVLGAGCMVGVFIFTFAQRPLFEKQTLTSSAGVLSALRDVASWMYAFGFGREVEIQEDSKMLAENPPSENVFEAVEGTSGLVVLPADSPLTLEEVAQSFSDHVTIEKDADGKSGVITPTFKNGSSTPYRFLLVPMNPP